MKKVWQRSIALAMTIAMLTSTVPMTAAAAGQTDTPAATFQIPMSTTLSESPVNPEAISTYDDVCTFVAFRLANEFEKQMDDLHTFISAEAWCQEDWMDIVNASEGGMDAFVNDVTAKMFEFIYKHTGVQSEGDTIKYGIKVYLVKPLYDERTVQVLAKIMFANNFFMNPDYDTSVVTDAVNSLSLDEMSEADKVAAIHDYIVSNVEPVPASDNITIDTMASALYEYGNHVASPTGFAVTFYRMALTAGLDARVVTGTKDGVAHAWNIVKVGDVYYNVDVHSDAKDSNLAHFMQYADMDGYVLDDEFTTDEFVSEYPMATAPDAGDNSGETTDPDTGETTDPDTGDNSGETTDPDTSETPDPDTDDNSGETADSDETEIKFEDVSADAWYAEAVNWAIANKVTVGTSDTTFSPDNACTRAEMVQFLYNAAGRPEVSNAQTKFEDVSTGAWYADAVAWAYENNITVGTSDTTFSPDDTCSRAEMVQFMFRVAGSPSESVDVSKFDDVAETAWYAEAVSWAIANKVTVGTSATTFSPDGTCIRAEAVQFLYNQEFNR